MEEKNELFQYTYSAKQQEEIRNIRKNYAAPEEDKMQVLRKLHHSATQKAQAWAIAIGVIGALILGSGMSLAMTDLGAMLGFGRETAMLIGIADGVIGLILVALAYPAYNRILKKARQRIAPEILRLTDELLK